jgi:hypothetical protein
MNERPGWQIQGALGLGSLAWAAFLLPHTSSFGWIVGNAVYGVAALMSAGLLRRGNSGFGRVIAILGLLAFGAANSVVARLACTTGGACSIIIAVTAAIISVQVAVVVVIRRQEARDT